MQTKKLAIYVVSVVLVTIFVSVFPFREKILGVYNLFLW